MKKINVNNLRLLNEDVKSEDVDDIISFELDGSNSMTTVSESKATYAQIIFHGATECTFEFLDF